MLVDDRDLQQLLYLTGVGVSAAKFEVEGRSRSGRYGGLGISRCGHFFSSRMAMHTHDRDKDAEADEKHQEKATQKGFRRGFHVHQRLPPVG